MSKLQKKKRIEDVPKPVYGGVDLWLRVGRDESRSYICGVTRNRHFTRGRGD